MPSSGASIRNNHDAGPLGPNSVAEPKAFELDGFHTTMLAAIQDYWVRTRDASSVPTTWRGDMKSPEYARYLRDGCELAKEEWMKYCGSKKDLTSGSPDATGDIQNQGSRCFEDIAAAIPKVSPGVTKTSEKDLNELQNTLQISMLRTKHERCKHDDGGCAMVNFPEVTEEAEKKFDEIFAKQILARMLMVTAVGEDDEDDTRKLVFAIDEYRFQVDGWEKYGGE
ncbi:hypothetical protein QFC22_005642 [Naganishia vaughanmartiniae]|uniref:Uncharacterized protein n=1 Tax=Naganishia vaughanmartiniae TaxID=1424756 RepID=A0ACC2WUG6_9TREE|nr:hypothetical protein QFC22_005642 [Naganishia vaughanmartiniae]